MRYVVVGGLATLLHGYARLTVDVAIDLAPEEARKVLQALVQNGFRPQAPVFAEAFADAATRETWLHEKHMKAFSLVDFANPMRVVDLLLKPEVPFDDLWTRSREAFISRTRVRIASLDDLITLKRQSGRAKDLADIEQLEAIRQNVEMTEMARRSARSSDTQPADWDAETQRLLVATMAATPAQRLAWLEDAIQLAYASGALKPKRLLSKAEWDAMGESIE